MAGAVRSGRKIVTASQTPILEVQDLVIRYGKRTAPAVEGVSFSITRGETLGLVGESGSGKTTIGRAILGLVPVASGRIVFEGRDITKAGPAERRALQGDLRAVFQDPFSSLNPRRPVGDALTEPLREAGMPRREREERARDVMVAVGLPASAVGRYPREFSGGQRQRIAIARALVTDPRLVVCDEAVSALDLSTQAQVLNLFADLRAGADLGYLFIAHDMAVVEFLAQRIIVLNRGRIVEEGATSEIIHNPQAHYTKVLMAASPVPDPDEQVRRRGAWQALKASAAAVA